MSRIKYKDWRPGGKALALVEVANAICADYRQQGYDLTLRQLYYQFVSKAIIENSQQSYKLLGDVVNNARMAGLMDWDYIVDRTRNLAGASHWDNPSGVIRSAAFGYAIDKWETQPTRVEVWVEKEALAGVVARAAGAADVDYFSCRGYVSQSEQWAAGRRIGGYIANGQNVVIIHLGDHDPSGIDMTRDITDRITTFITRDFATDEMGDEDAQDWEVQEEMSERCGGRTPFTVNRIALNMDQVRQYNPPPNFAKITDSRARDYIANFGDRSWELDALDPTVLNTLIADEVDVHLEHDLWDEAVAREEKDVRLLKAASRRWTELVTVLDTETAE